MIPIPGTIGRNNDFMASSLLPDDKAISIISIVQK